MNLRLALYELIRQHRLDRPSAMQLLALAGLGQQPAALAVHLWRTMAVLGAALAGLGIVLWIAANWDTMGRASRFVLLQGFVLTMCLGAAWRAAARLPLLLLALLGTGALLAFFGQTYQAGTDPWQLSALWALLTLPLALAARSDVVWLPWVVVAMMGISEWVLAHSVQHLLLRQGPNLSVYAMALSATIAVAMGMAPALRRFTGAGLWAFRCAVLQALAMITFIAISGLFHDTVAVQYPLGVVLQAGCMVLMGSRRHFEVFLLSAAALSLNVLLAFGLFYWLLKTRWVAETSIDIRFLWLIVGMGAAGMLAATVSLVLRLVRRATGDAR